VSVDIDASSLVDLEHLFESFPEKARQAMSIALNEVARGPALKAARRNIMAQLNFPEGYLDTRVEFKKPATPYNLEARIVGRDRPTSLARFVQPGTPTTPAGRAGSVARGVNVVVKRGAPRRIPQGFLVNLRNSNIGLAIRLKPGETVHGVQRFNPVRLFPNVYLLYGPSVDQVLSDVGDQISEEVTSDIAEEFNRQFARLTGLG
jgi:hypothetical protein